MASSGNPSTAMRSAPHSASLAADLLRHRAGQRRRDDRWQKHEIDEAERHHADSERRRDENEIDVGERADEGEQNAESDGEAGAKLRNLDVLPPRPCAHRFSSDADILNVSVLDRREDQSSSGDIERSEHDEVCSEPCVVDDGRRNQAANQIARDVAGDVGRKGACRLFGR